MNNDKETPAVSTTTTAAVPDQADIALPERISARAAIIGGGITVNRLLPSAQRRMIGAWCFLDHAGPAEFEEGEGLDVGPHPHIGLQTFTWMIKGEGLHRDSLGNEQIIRPGEVNLMTAGRGIVHTEESPEGERHMHAAQLWIALPESEQDRAPAFDHYPQLPSWVEQSVRLTLLAGSFAGYQAPSRVYSPLVGVDLTWQGAGSSELSLTPAFEYGLLVLEGRVTLSGQTFLSNELAYLGHGLSQLTLSAEQGTRLLLLGGEPFAGRIHLWWNFVAHSREAITQALADWNGHNLERFPEVTRYQGARLSAPALPWANKR